MAIAVTGSIATDHLLHFPGRFSEQLLPDQLDRVSLSFLIDDLVVRRGGVAANIAFGLGQLGLQPVLIGAVGHDFDEYRAWLERHGVDCDSVHVSEVAQTARFICTTDETLCQIASFYAGAMAEARNIELAPAAERVGGFDLVHIGANDPQAMIRHSQECRDRGYRFAADPSQQLARMTGDDIRELIRGAEYLLTNDYEKGLLESKTGLSDSEVLQQVKIRVTTFGERGVRIEGKDENSQALAPVNVPAVPDVIEQDPTGSGDAFRAGFFAGITWGLSLDRSAQIGNLLAATALESDGAQEYEIKPAEFAGRLGQVYGEAAGAEVSRYLPG